ncbi:MAG: cobalamin-dependent protein [Candidatus Aminicenantales bacterium]
MRCCHRPRSRDEDVPPGLRPDVRALAAGRAGKKPLSLEDELFAAVLEGEKQAAGRLARRLIKEGRDALQIMEKILAPALRRAGEYYEQKTHFLPQLVLRNYGYSVTDLGKNVDSRKILDAALEEDAGFIGLSALMTTTMEEMRRVIALRNARAPHIKIIVGGAAVTPSFARRIGADAYAKDAMDTVRKIQGLLEKT